MAAGARHRVFIEHLLYIIEFLKIHSRKKWLKTKQTNLFHKLFHVRNKKTLGIFTNYLVFYFSPFLPQPHFFLFSFSFFRATFTEYGSSQARVELELQQLAYTTATATATRYLTTAQLSTW